MLSNAYFLAKFRFDTAENEPAKNLQKFAKFANFADPNPLNPNPGGDEVAAVVRLPEARERPVRAAPADAEPRKTGWGPCVAAVEGSDFGGLVREAGWLVGW